MPVGTSLSGAVDSSAVVALSARLAGDRRRHAFTAGLPGFTREEWRALNVEPWLNAFEGRAGRRAEAVHR